MHIDRLTPRANTINEFPFFTFLYGDLQPHMIALPLALAALGLMVALVTTKDEGRRTKALAAFGRLSFVVWSSGAW